MNRAAEWIIGLILCVCFILGDTIYRIIGNPVQYKTEFKMTVDINGKDNDITIPININKIDKEN